MNGSMIPWFKNRWDTSKPLKKPTLIRKTPKYKANILKAPDQLQPNPGSVESLKTLFSTKVSQVSNVSVDA